MGNKLLNRVSDGYTYAADTDLTVMTCPVCGIVYAIPERLRANAHARGDWQIMWYCPNGHELGFGESDIDRERKARKRAEEARQRALDREQATRDLLTATENSLRAQKGATTKARKRAAAALCPVPGCNRHFVQMQRHLKTKHPDWQPTSHTHD